MSLPTLSDGRQLDGAKLDPTSLGGTIPWPITLQPITDLVLFAHHL